MKKFFRRIFQILLLIFIIIQFIRPAKNKSDQFSNNDITKKYAVSPEVLHMLQTSCYDCHSNNTNYPWYSYVQPVAWWLNSHIKDGKRGLNFSEFASYRIGKQYKRFDDIIENVKTDEMPLDYYLWIHKSAKLSDQQKLIILNWAGEMRDSIKANYPADSLVKKKTP